MFKDLENYSSGGYKQHGFDLISLHFKTKLIIFYLFMFSSIHAYMLKCKSGTVSKPLNCLVKLSIIFGNLIYKLIGCLI